MTDHITRAAAIVNEANWKADFKGGARADEIARALDGAGLLAGPEHDAAVAANALREMRDEMSRWEGWDTREIGHAFLSESVLDALADAANRIEREAGESGADS